MMKLVTISIMSDRSSLEYVSYGTHAYTSALVLINLDRVLQLDVYTRDNYNNYVLSRALVNVAIVITALAYCVCTFYLLDHYH